MASTDDYIALITSEHADKPLFVAVIRALVQPAVDSMNLLQTFPDLYDLDAAQGTQLDAVGLWVGISRQLRIPLTGVYFSWDDVPLLGWDSGSWQGLYDPTTGLTSLPDDEYRQLIRAKIAANRWTGGVYDAEAIWAQVFAGTGREIIVQDNQDMTMTVGFVGAPLTAIQQALLTGGYFPLKPEGVRIRFYAIPPDTGPLFAWDANSSELQGWDTGRWPQEIIPS